MKSLLALGLVVICFTGCVDEYPYPETGTMLDLVTRHCLVEDCPEKLERLLDSGLPVDELYSYGWPPSLVQPARTLFHQAILLGATNCIEMLVRRGADVAKRDAIGTTSLTYLAATDGPASVRYADRLLATGLFDVNEANSYSRTPLVSAVWFGNVDYAKWLIDHGADCNAMSTFATLASRRPILYEAVNAERPMFDFFVNLPGVDFSPHGDQVGCAMEDLSPDLPDYEQRFSVLVTRGARYPVAYSGVGILELNMIILGDCGKRMEFLCAYGPSESELTSALEYADVNGFTRCTRVIKRHLAETKRKRNREDRAY